MSDSRTGSSSRQVQSPRRRSGFTLVELLVVVAIIVILVGILIPAVGSVRKASRVASTQALIVQLQSAIEQYHMDFNAYPGPLSNDQIYQDSTSVAPPVYWRTDADASAGPPVWPANAAHRLYHISMAENLVLGLLGGLEVNPATGDIFYRASLVGQGPRGLAQTGMNSGRAHSPYMPSAADLTTSSVNNDPANPGHFKDLVGDADDSIIPEFVDRFPSPMPILYLRARVGASNYTNTGVGPPVVIGDVGNVRKGWGPSAPPVAQYDVNQYIGYTGVFSGTWPWPTLNVVALGGPELPMNGGWAIGDGKNAVYWYGPSEGASAVPRSPSALIAAGYVPHHGLSSLNWYPLGPVGNPLVQVPFTAPTYFRNPAFVAPGGAFTTQDQPRGKDTYILIGAGPDRVYGTADDITSFGLVVP